MAKEVEQMNGDGVEEWRSISLATTKKEKLVRLKEFVRNNIQDRRVRGYILASLGEL